MNLIIKKQIKELKDIQKKYKNENIKRNESIRQSLMQNINNNNNDNNNNIANNNNEQNFDFDNIPISESLLIKPKGSKEDLYKTINIFSKEKDVNKSTVPQLLEKNWHEICYIYDDYDIYDVNFILKAVGLSDKNSSFQEFSFYAKRNCEVELLTVNGKKINYEKKSYIFNFKISLKNLETAKIHIKYKHLKNKDSSSNETELRYEECYGITKKVNKNCVGKYILILKGNFDILNFEDDNFLIKNEKNKNESEYFWGGKIPSEGKKFWIKFTRKKAKWNATIHFKATEDNGLIINGFKFYLKSLFFGANINIIDLKFSSPQKMKVYLDEGSKKYIVEYENNYSECEISENLIFENKSKPGWNIDLSDEEVERKMPKEDVRDKAKLKVIAQKIIKEFDEKHKNSKFEYYDFMKIAEWVHKNIKYNYSYSGKHKYTALDIYKNKAGVCHHFTRLSNALLFSLGYKVAYIYGLVSKLKKFGFENCHAWSVIKIGNTWYPFDSTWGIYRGKVPITHIFLQINLDQLLNVFYTSWCNISYDQKIFGSLIEN